MVEIRLQLWDRYDQKVRRSTAVSKISYMFFCVFKSYFNLKESDKDREFLEATLRHLSELDAKYGNAFDHELLEALRENFT